MRLRVTVLGCGTSTGVPIIGCDCRVCGSPEPRNQRLRPGLRLEVEHGREDEHGTERGVVLIDTPTDLRQQALRFALDRVDAVVYTHAHADHVFGLDELRIFNFRQAAPIPCYGSPETLARLRQTFAYVFEAGQEGGGKPKLELRPVQGPFSLLGLRFLPVPVWHGELEVLAYRIGDFAYVTDCNRIPEASFAALAGVRTLLLDALRYTPHPTHFSVAEALVAARRIGAEQTYLTHLNHDVDYLAPEVPLPEGVEFAYDGLVLDLEVDGGGVTVAEAEGGA